MEASDKENILLWLNFICENCGFNEIILNSENGTSENNSNNYLLNQKIELKNKKETNSFKSKIETNINSDNRPRVESVKSGKVSTKNKDIAGKAAYSVGSFNLENLFKKNKLSEDLDTKSSNIFFEPSSHFHSSYSVFGSNQINNDSMTKENYINLKECQSGQLLLSSVAQSGSSCQRYNNYTIKLKTELSQTIK